MELVTPSDAGVVPAVCVCSTQFLDKESGVYVCTPVFAAVLAVTLVLFLVRHVVWWLHCCALVS